MNLQEMMGSPPFLWVRRARYEYHVRRTGQWRYWGVFQSYEAALAGAPKRRDMIVGYPAPGMARFGQDIYERMHLFDYPVVYWLNRLFGEMMAERPVSLVDLGGHLGEKYRVYHRYVTLPRNLTWTVCDTEDAVQEAIRQGLQSPFVQFTADKDCIDGCDVLFASGSLQYMEEQIWDLIDAAEHPPAYIVINKLPLSKGPDFWTIQNAHARGLVAYHVFNRERFFAEVARCGYGLRDEWTIPHISVEIPFRGLATEGNSGVVLDRSGQE